jgi:hypothetical protein
MYWKLESSDALHAVHAAARIFIPRLTHRVSKTKPDMAHEHSITIAPRNSLRDAARTSSVSSVFACEMLRQKTFNAVLRSR